MSASGRRAVRDFRFFVWERFAGMEGTRVFSAGTWSDLRGLLQIQTDEPERGANLARSLFMQLKHAQDKSCGLAAEIQARIRVVAFSGVGI